MSTPFRYTTEQQSDQRVERPASTPHRPREQRVIQSIYAVLADYDQVDGAAALRRAGEQLGQVPAYPRTDLHALYDGLWRVVYGRDTGARAQAVDALMVWRAWWQAQHRHELAHSPSPTHPS